MSGQGASRPHPPGIVVLFFAEMWERYSYYGMRSLLIFYLIERFSLAPSDAVVTYGAYTSLVYGSAIVGGYFADRLIGLWRSVQWGGALILTGHLALAWEGQFARDAAAVAPLFYVALACIVAGTGFFKPSSTALVSALYPDRDPRREAGYYVFYLGINLGSALAALTVGYVGQRLGWSYGFGLAAVGMLLGLLVTMLAGHHVAPHAPRPPAEVSRRIWQGPSVLFATVLGAYLLLRQPDRVGVALLVALGLGSVILWRQCNAGEDRAARRRLAAAAVVLGVATLFWSLFEQAGSSFALFTAQSVDLALGAGVALTPAQTQFFNPLFILLGTPFFASLWLRLARAGHEPGVAVKLALAMLQVGIGFVCLVIGIAQAATGAEASVALVWLVLAYLFHTSGELCLSPLAMSTLARLVPAGSTSLVMGLWLFTLAAGNFVGGQLAARIVGTRPAEGGPVPLAEFSRVFLVVAALSALVAVILAFASRRIDALGAPER